MKNTAERKSKKRGRRYRVMAIKVQDDDFVRQIKRLIDRLEEHLHATQ
jgi:hypothetical protein